MGPRLDSRGNSGRERLHRRRQLTSIGPRLDSRGNPLDTDKLVAAIVELQWGRDLIVAETYATAWGFAASRELQWGRDLIVAETD